jgi:hypothetical protein
MTNIFNQFVLIPIVLMAVVSAVGFLIYLHGLVRLTRKRGCRLTGYSMLAAGIILLFLPFGAWMYFT